MLDHDPLFVEGAEVGLSLFDKEYKHLYDTGLENVLPETTMRVFRNMRRLIWRNDWSGSATLDQLTRSGNLGLITTTGAIGIRSGIMEDKNTRIALLNLAALGWIEKIETTQAGTVFLLGRVATGKDGRRLRKTSHGEGALHHDAFVDRLYCDMYHHATLIGRQNNSEKGWLTSEARGGLMWPERMAFCARWIRQHHPEAKLRAGCEKLLLKVIEGGGR